MGAASSLFKFRKKNPTKTKISHVLPAKNRRDTTKSKKDEGDGSEDGNMQLSDHPSLMSAPLSPTLVTALQQPDTPADEVGAGDRVVLEEGEEDEEEEEGEEVEETVQFEYKVVKSMDSATEESSDETSSYTSSDSFSSSDSEDSSYDVIHITMDPIVARCQQTLRLLYHSDLHDHRQHWSDMSLDTMRFGARPTCVWSTMDHRRPNVYQPNSMFSLPPPQKARSQPSMPHQQLPNSKSVRSKPKKDSDTETPPSKTRSSTFKYSRNFSGM